MNRGLLAIGVLAALAGLVLYIVGMVVRDGSCDGLTCMNRTKTIGAVLFVAGAGLTVGGAPHREADA